MSPSLHREDLSFSTSWSAIGRLLIHTVAFFIGFTVLTFYITRSFPAVGSKDSVGFKWQLLQESPEPIQTLLFGDSTAHYGLDPDIFENRLGGPALNLATFEGVTPTMDAGWLRDAGRRWGPPKRIFIVRTITGWTEPEDPERLSVALASVPTSLRQASSLSLCFAHFFKPYATLGDYLRAVSFKEKDRDVTLKKGWVAVHLKDTAKSFDGNVIRHMDPDQAARLTLSDPSRQSMDFLTAWAQRYAIDVIIAPPPWHDALRDTIDFRRYAALYQRLFEPYAVRSQHVFILPPSTFPNESFIDGRHLNEDGARRFSSRLVDQYNSKRASH